jgi:MFS family permease
MQGVAGSAAWIVGFATLADNAGPEHLGKLMGVAMSIVTAGIIGGPMVSGAILQLVGYWAAWSAPMAVLTLNIIARLIVIENQHPLFNLPSSSDTQDFSSVFSNDTTTIVSVGEATSLLSNGLDTYHSYKAYPAADQPENAPTNGFYCTMLRDARVLAGLVSALMFACMMSGFDATLPLHLRDVFGWRSLPIGMTFLALQIPNIFLSPLAGWLRDRHGLRYPTTVGWSLMAPLLWLLGVPGSTHSPWIVSDKIGEFMFIICILGIGAVTTLVRGAGGLQLLGQFSIFHNYPSSFFATYVLC